MGFKLRSFCRFADLTRQAIYVAPLSLLLATTCLAGPTHNHGAEARGRLGYDSKKGANAELHIAPLPLDGGSTITLVTPQEWRALGTNLVESLKGAHLEFEEQLGALPSISTTLRVMPEDLFYKVTGAPSWTNALFFRGQIFIPVSQKSARDKDNLVRSIRHEYTHSVVHELSGGRAPGWLDEGLAQWAEGSENPALRPALLRYLRDNKPLPFSSLQGGFTQLEMNSVAAAYAQSLISTAALLKTFGFVKLRAYFDLLKADSGRDYAFERAFGMTPDFFESLIENRLRDWAKTF